MPPKFKFTKDEIVNAAVEVVRERGGRFCIKLSSSKLLPKKTVRFTPPRRRLS